VVAAVEADDLVPILEAVGPDCKVTHEVWSTNYQYVK